MKKSLLSIGAMTAVVAPVAAVVACGDKKTDDGLVNAKGDILTLNGNLSFNKMKTAFDKFVSNNVAKNRLVKFVGIYGDVRVLMANQTVFDGGAFNNLLIELIKDTRDLKVTYIDEDSKTGTMEIKYLNPVFNALVGSMGSDKASEMFISRKLGKDVVVKDIQRKISFAQLKRNELENGMWT